MINIFALALLIVPSTALYDDRPCVPPPSGGEYIPEMQLLDRYILLICAPLAFICTVFNTSTFFIFPKTRRLPGDIIFAISLCECVLSIHWFASSYYDLTRKHAPPTQGTFCQFNAFLSIMAGTGEFIYNCAFCIYLRFTVSRVLKVNMKLRLILHFVSLCLVFGVPSYLYITKRTGLSLTGTCSFKQSNGFPLFGLLLVLLYFILSIYTILFFKNSVPNTDTLLAQKRDFIKYYFNYIMASSVIWLVLAVSQVFVGLNCTDFHEPKLQMFVTLSSCAKLATPIVLSIMRYHDPTIKKKIMIIFGKVFKFRTKIQNSSSSIDGANWIDKIQQNLKYLQVMSILTGVRHNYKNNETVSFSDVTPDKKSILSESDDVSRDQVGSVQFELMQGRQRHISLDADISNQMRQIFNFGEYEFNERTVVKINGSQDKLPMKMITYAPQIFSVLVEMDRQMIDPYRSLDPILNAEQIQSFKNPDGGKSGEFFFFTADYSLILKTMTDEEIVAFLKRLPQYLHHVTQNDSLISIIYGVFSFERLDVNGHPTVHVLMMRNISQCPSKYKLRSFDMKGSEFDREVLKKLHSADVDLSKLTLKDTDFMKLEARIKVESGNLFKLRDILLKDAELFKQLKLMDYSLLVIKVDWNRYLADHPHVTIKSIKNRFSKSMYMVESTEQNGVYYHIAIIDYLQEWNHQKQREQFAKKFINANAGLDLSAKEPTEYGNRFQEKLIRKIFVED